RLTAGGCGRGQEKEGWRRAAGSRKKRLRGEKKSGTRGENARLDSKGVPGNPYFGFRIGYNPLNGSVDAHFLKDSNFGILIVRAEPVLPENEPCHSARSLSLW